MPERVAEQIRQRTPEIVEEWERVARAHLPAIAHMTRPLLLDHLPELLDGLAAFIEGDTERAERMFELLVQGHALQRLGIGVGIETLTHEYMYLRAILLRELLELPPSPAIRESLIRMHEGLDRAVSRALDFYGARREQIRERFISILGHDLRGPLSSISMAANLIVAKPGADPRALAERIARACARMARMVDEVLDFARGHLGGGIPANPVLNDLGEICRAAVDEVHQAHPECRITVEVTGELRGPLDRDRVHQAIANLLANAVEHGTGSIEVRAFEGDDQQSVRCAVTSHGNPIPAERIPRLFDPFARAGDAGARGGLGLGLYIVDQIALAHGGACEVVSSEQGTTFTLWFPRVPGDHRRRLAEPESSGSPVPPSLS